MWDTPFTQRSWQQTAVTMVFQDNLPGSTPAAGMLSTAAQGGIWSPTRKVLDCRSSIAPHTAQARLRIEVSK